MEIWWNEGRAEEVLLMLNISLKEFSFLNSIVEVGVKIN